MKLNFQPLTPERWHELETLFGERGACGGCWCMWWRLKKSEFEKNKGSGNKRAFKKLVGSGAVPGLLAYAGDEPIGWCAVETRGRYARALSSRASKDFANPSDWLVTCFFIRKDFRKRGVSIALLKAACKHVVSHGGSVVEGQPGEPRASMPDAFVWRGLVSAFRAAGFSEAARPSSSRVIMRWKKG